MNNGNRKGCGDACYVGMHGRRDQNPQIYTQHTNMQDKNSELKKPTCKIIQGILDVILGSEMQVLSCLSALNLLVSGATLTKSSMAGVEI